MPPNGKARAFLPEPCARLGRAAAQAQYHRHMPLDIFARKRGGIQHPSMVCNFTSILPRSITPVNTGQLFSLNKIMWFSRFPTREVGCIYSRFTN